jgi:hypothetical protein
MARRDLFIPEEVKASIRKHLRNRTEDAINYGYESASEEEDTLTGDLGASLRTSNQKVEVKNLEIKSTGTWKWSINYSKFRGRGHGATEKILGADGIFELTLQIGNITEKKSIMFQTKKDWDYDQNVLAQALKLTNWREAAFVLNFTRGSYEAYDLDTVISSRGRRPQTDSHIDLIEFLGGNFLDCVVGDVDLNYDSRNRKLTWFTMQGEYVTTKFSIPEKIRLKITAPNPGGITKVISNDDVFAYRMDAAPEEILSLGRGYSEKDLKKARDEKAKTFHLDTSRSDDDFLNQLNNMRMQEVNSAHEKLKVKFIKQ